MGNTRDTLTTDAGAQVRFVVAIQGYDTLLTNHSAAAVVTAWSGTDWSTALTGLAVPGVMKQSITPYRPKIEAETLTLTIHPDEDETFASTVFATEKSAGNITKLDDGTNLDSDDTTVTVHSTAGFASSGTIHVGTEAIAYTGTTATQFTGCTRGKYSPFGRSGSAAFGRPHRTSQAPGAGTVASPWVTDYPRVWIGRHIAVYAHVLRGSVLDTKAEAELIWAGAIADVSENEHGHTSLTCLDARDMVRSCVLLHDQFTAKPVRGAYLEDGKEIYVKVVTTGTGSYGVESDTFIVGTDITAGYHTVDELVSALNVWFNAGSWTDNPYCWIDPNDNKWKFVVANIGSGGNVWTALLEFHMESVAFGHLLGFDHASTEPSDQWVSMLGMVQDSELGVDPTPTIRSANPVGEYVIAVDQFGDGTLDLGDAIGTFVDQRAQLPEPYQSMTAGGETWGIVDLSGQACALVRKEAGDQFSAIKIPRDLLRALGYDAAEDQIPFTFRIYYRGESPPLIRQLIWLSGDGADVMPRLVASTGTSAYNHATYDDYGYSLGAGVPWDLLGDAFLQSCAELFGGGVAPLSILIATPTKLADVLAPELALRNAHLVLRDGGLVFLTPSFVSPTTATHALTEGNKAAPSDRQLENRANYGVTRSYLVNHIKVLYGRKMSAPGQDAEYREVLEISSEQSKTDYGVAQPITIKAANHIGEQAPGGDSIREMAIELAAGALSEFSRPVLQVERSYDASLFYLVPGDTATLADSHVRDPTTGGRGISSRACWILSTEWNWATATGRVALALADDDRRAVYSPCAQVDDTANAGGFTAGYSSGTSTLRCYANEHSLSGDSDASYFSAGEEIEICELSPATTSSPTRWVRTIDSISSNDITLTAALSSPAFDSALKYRITSVIYSSADSTQTPDAYMADDADAQVLDTRRPYIWAKQSGGTTITAAADSTRRHEYPVTDGRWDGDGYPVHPGMHRAAIDTINNLIDYVGAPQNPITSSQSAAGSTQTISTTSTTYVTIAVWPQFLTRGRWVALSRHLYLAPMIQISSGSETVTIRATSSRTPPIGDANVASFTGPYRQVTFTQTGSTSIAVPAAQALDIVRFPDDECTYITVEMKVTAGTGTYYGMTRCNLGPME